MSRNARILVAVLVVGFVGAVGLGVAFARGWLGTDDRQAIPSCSQLPSAADAKAALSAHEPLTEMMLAAGALTVDVATPCDNGGSLVRVELNSKDDANKIDQILGTQEGYGVPVQVTY